MREYHERSCSRCSRVALHDIDDAYKFVQAAINRSGLSLSYEHRIELVAEGLRALTKMAREYQPGYGGRDAAGSRFSGYAAKFLPGKLSDAWHHINDDVLVTQPDGSRKYAQQQKPAALQAQSPDVLDQIKALQVDPWNDPDVIQYLPRLLTDWWEERCDQVAEYMQLRQDGYRNSDIPDLMRIVPQTVRELEAFSREMLRRARQLERESTGRIAVAA